MASNIHRGNEKSEFQGCTCKMDKILSTEMCIKFESGKTYLTGNQCDNSDFDIKVPE